MDRSKIQKPLTQFQRSIADLVSVDELIVFGSHLEGTASEDSDIDVIVVSKDFQRMSEDQRLDLLYTRSTHIRPEIHPWGFTPTEVKQASRLTTLGYARDQGYRFTTV